MRLFISLMAALLAAAPAFADNDWISWETSGYLVNCVPVGPEKPLQEFYCFPDGAFYLLHDPHLDNVMRHMYSAEWQINHPEGNCEKTNSF